MAVIIGESIFTQTEFTKMAEGSTKQDQDERRNVKEANPTCCTAPVVNCNCITMCQGNHFQLISIQYVCSEFAGIFSVLCLDRNDATDLTNN